MIIRSIIAFLNLRLIFLILFVLSWSEKGAAQLISNPSFEGTPMRDYPPPPWQPCDPKSTPDTQPGYWEVTQTASQGNTYLSMVTRGTLGPNAFTYEQCQTDLSEPLEQGKNYILMIDLAFSTTFGHESLDYGWISYNTPVILRVWGGITFCHKHKILVESPLIDHEQWQTHRFEFSSADNFNYLTLDVYYASMPVYFGNMLLDNIVLLKDIPKVNVNVPNVFTPNGDEINETFLPIFSGPVTDYSLDIYNRRGFNVFHTTNPLIGWDGKYQGAPALQGAYVWILEYTYEWTYGIEKEAKRGTVIVLR